MEGVVKSTPKKEKYISVLRIVATVAVVLLHTANSVLDKEGITQTQTMFFSSVKSLLAWTVPAFIMITGALLLNTKKDITPSQCIKKYVLRMVVVLFLFGIPFSMIEIFFVDRTFSLGMILKATLNVVVGKSWTHLWYLYMLIGIYCLLPIYNIYVKNTSRELQKHMLIILFVFNFVIVMLNKAFDIEIAFELPIASFSLFASFYFLAGKYFADSERGSNFKNLIGIALLVIVVIVMVYFEMERLLWYDSPVIALLTILVFNTFRNINWKSDGISKVLWEMDRACFGVYLIHPFFIHLVYKLIKMLPLDYAIYPLATVIFALVFTIASFICAFIMRKIPILNKYV